MGTNYYAIRKVDNDLQEKIISKVKERNYEEAKNLMPIEIHIGKSSAGFKFLFNHSNWKYFEKTIESLQSFLKTCYLKDEYGTSMTYEEFWSFVKLKENDIDGKEYYTNWDKYNIDYKTGKPLPKTDRPPQSFYEEYHFGLRFSDSIEF